MNADNAAKSKHQANAAELIAAALPGFEALFEAAVAAVRQEVLVDGRMHTYWKVDAGRLRQVLGG